MALPRISVLLAAGALVCCGREPEGQGGTFGQEDRAAELYATQLRPPSDAAYSSMDPDVVETEEGSLRRIVTYSETYDIHRVYKSMQGPSSNIQVSLQQGPGPPEILWIKGVGAEIVDEEGENTKPQEFMCHVVGGIRDPLEHGARFGFRPIDERFATLSQGQYHKEYPRGFGVPILSTEVIQFSSQVLNHNRPHQFHRVRHRIVLIYLRDSEARMAMQAIRNTYAQVMVQVSGPPGSGYFGVAMPDPEIHGSSCAVGQNADLFGKTLEDPYGREFSAHWVVLPGRVTNQTLATHNMRVPYDTTIHTIDVHLHPFGETLELRDLTSDETLFRSKAAQADRGVGLANVQIYSSEEGIPIFADHQYAIVSTYDNTSDALQDAMASFYIGFHDREFDRAVAMDPAMRRRRSRQQAEERIARHRQAVLERPGDALAQHQLGLDLYQLGRYAEAVKALEQAVALAPGDEQMRTSLSRARRQLELVSTPFE